jgi:Polyketide cyclase / dehydrase and lipid transport
MARYHAAVQSQRPAQDTFDYLATFSNAVEWDPGVLEARQLDPGPVVAGTRFRLVVPFLGRRLPLTYAVTGYGPGRRVTLTAANSLLRATDRIEVTDDAVVSYDAEVVLRGPLRILDALLRPGFRVVAERAAAGLAEILAAGPARQPGVRQ